MTVQMHLNGEACPMASKSFVDLAGLQHYDEKLNEAVAAKYVNLTGAQTISGAKTHTGELVFQGSISGINKTSSTDDANTLYNPSCGRKNVYYTTTNGGTTLTNVPAAVNTTLESRTLRYLSSSDWCVEQIAHNTSGLYYRRGSASGWNAWKTFAFTDSSITGNAANVTGTVAIANGGTGATTRETAVKNLFNANIGSSPSHFLTGTANFGNSGYTSIADAKTALGINATDANPTLAWGTKSKVATVNGVDINVTMPANPNTNTDTLMTQNVSTTNATYPILAVATANANANQGAKTGIFGAGVKLNPSTSTVSATRFDGAISIYKMDALNTDSASNDIPLGLRGLSRQARSCKTAFTPVANITVEYSTDGGTTWLDYEATDAQKQALFAMQHGASFQIGKGTAGGTSAVSTNCKLRITVAPADRYATVDTLYLWVCAYNHTMKVDIETSTIGAKTTFSAMRTGVGISGWSGANLISFTRTQYGGGSTQTSNRYAYRFIFYCTAIGANAGYPEVKDIRLYGPFSHTAANNMMAHDSLYTWDVSQNAAFPAQITATKFNGPATKVEASIAAGSTGELIRASIATNDYFRIMAGGESNAGYVEFATADDYNEPIYVRQYQGAFTTLKRTATLLDGSGNTSFPGTVTAASFTGPLTGNVTGNCSGTSGQAYKAVGAGGYADIIQTVQSDNNNYRSCTIRCTNGDGFNEIVLGAHNESNAAPSGIAVRNTNGTLTATAPTPASTTDSSTNIATTAWVRNATGNTNLNAATATKATQDGSGNNIVNTYATKAELADIISVTSAQIDTLFA